MAGITEVNPLIPHYRCPHCHHTEFFDDPKVKSGYDLPDKVCPECGHVMKGDGQNIPFQTFLTKGKTPDIDLNFSNEYQAKAHAFIRDVFGEAHAYRAGTIGTIQEKTAYGYVSGYCEKMGITDMRRVMRNYLAQGCQEVKRTTGQHQEESSSFRKNTKPKTSHRSSILPTIRILSGKQRTTTSMIFMTMY